MVNLTKDQITLLRWMRTGRSFQVCSDYSPNQGDVLPQRRLPVRVFAKTIAKLVKEGLICYQTKRHFGIRWDEFFITDKGKAAV